MKYYVDWDDPCYPQIRTEKYCSSYTETKTFGECKKEIIEHFQIVILDARDSIRSARNFNTKDVLE